MGSGVRKYGGGGLVVEAVVAVAAAAGLHPEAKASSHKASAFPLDPLKSGLPHLG